MKSKSIIIVLLMITISTVSFSFKTIFVVTDTWAPYVYQENNEVKGVDYEIMMKVFEKMGYTVNFKFYPWKRCMAMIENKKADAVLDMNYSEEKSKFMYYPNEEISDNVLVFFQLKEKNYTFNKLEDLRNLKIGTLVGYEYNKEIREATYFKKEPVSKIEQNFKKLILGRLDLFIVSKNVGLFEAKKFGILDKIKYLPKELSGGKNYVAFSKKPVNNMITIKFSETLKEFKTTKEYKKILLKYGQ